MASPRAPLSPPSGFRGLFRPDDDARGVYAEAAGIARVLPRAIAVPVDVHDLSLLVRWASDAGTPLIPRGSGSSMPGGAVGDGVVVDLSRWRSVEPVDVEARTMRVGPGVLRQTIATAAAHVGLRFPVDPSSGAFCTIGGMASTNAAGAHSLKFGATRQWIRAIDCVFADGTCATVMRGAARPAVPAIERLSSIEPSLMANEEVHASVHDGVRKESSGYGVAAFSRSREIVDLLVGSEGTLAFFVGLEVDLVPVAPATSSVFAAFRSLEEAVAAANATRELGAAACELLDRTFLDVAGRLGDEHDVPVETEAALLAEVEGEDQASAERMAALVEEAFRANGAATVRVALDRATETELWELRHAASPILARLDPRLRSMQFIEDCAVPPAALPAYVRGVRRILEMHETRGVIFGHAGDAHVHVNPLVDFGRSDWRGRVEGILDGVVTLAASLGGTLAGEHGDGRLRSPLLPRVWTPAALGQFRVVKNTFDPIGILNPGVKVAPAESRAIDVIKYDPAAAPISPAARHALDVVERDRAYASFRLALLDELR